MEVTKKKIIVIIGLAFILIVTVAYGIHLHKLILTNKKIENFDDHLHYYEYVDGFF